MTIREAYDLGFHDAVVFINDVYLKKITTWNTYGGVTINNDGAYMKGYMSGHFYACQKNGRGEVAEDHYGFRKIENAKQNG